MVISLSQLICQCCLIGISSLSVTPGPHLSSLPAVQFYWVIRDYSWFTPSNGWRDFHCILRLHYLVFLIACFDSSDQIKWKLFLIMITKMISLFPNKFFNVSIFSAIPVFILVRTLSFSPFIRMKTKIQQQVSILLCSSY